MSADFTGKFEIYTGVIARVHKRPDGEKYDSGQYVIVIDCDTFMGKKIGYDETGSAIINSEEELPIGSPISIVCYYEKEHKARYYEHRCKKCGIEVKILHTSQGAYTNHCPECYTPIETPDREFIPMEGQQA